MAAVVTKPRAMTLSIGVDIGQKIDSSAIVVAEHQAGDTGTTFTVRHLERRPLGEPYPTVAARVAAVVTGAVRHARRPRYATPATHPDHPDGWLLSDGFDFPLSAFVVIDSTGVGLPVAELVTAALAAAGLDVFRVSLTVELAVFTFGERLSWSNGERRVGKGYLVSRLQSLLQTGRVRLPDTGEARALAAELLNYEIKVDPDGDAKFGAFKTGSHDDLVTALGLAVLEDREPGVAGTLSESGRWVTR